jgi:23S rRNA (adenine2503-C2)-methyltransferase
MKCDLKSLTIEEIEALALKLGLEPYRARQIAQWVFRHHAVSVDEMTSLSKEIREKLKRVAGISSLAPVTIAASRDGSKKYLFKTADGYGVETVLMPEKNHQTLCISTQIGCSLGCRFCFTGTLGLTRNLSTAEILNQVSAVLKAEKSKEKLPNLVFMGMGEPLLNYENVLKSLKILLSPWGFNFSHRKITVSTAGITPLIRQLAEDLPVNLAISLNAPDDKIRSYLMPVNKKYPLKQLLKEARSFPVPSRKRITFEYILIKDVNDSPAHAEALARLLKNIPCKINLIPFNEFPGTPLQRPDDKRILQFQSILHNHHFTAPIRVSKGSDIVAACGQLGGTINQERTSHDAIST